MGIGDLGTRDKRQVVACRVYCAIAMRQWRRGRGDGDYLNYPGIQETTGCLNILFFLFSPGTHVGEWKKTDGIERLPNQRGADWFQTEEISSETGGYWEKKLQ